MARSTLFALLVLLLIQVALAVPFGITPIVNRAANGALKGDPFSVLTVNPGDLNARPWFIQPFDEGVKIAALSGPDEPSFFVHAKYGKPLLLPEEQKWYFENAGENSYKIKLPNEDQVLGWDERSRQVRLQAADGSPEQLWSIRRYDYGRMYRQY